MAAVRPGAWRRLKEREHPLFSRFGFIAAWRLDLPKKLHRHPLVDHLVVGIDEQFSFSDARVVALQAIGPGVPAWPHVEPRGNLCLRTSKYSSPAPTRVLTALEDALEVFLMDPDERESELRREVLSYWAQRATLGRDNFLSIVEPRAGSRDIVWHGTSERDVLFADHAGSLNTWLSRVGTDPPKSVATTRLVWLDDPPLPEMFPKVGNDVMELAGRITIEPHVRSGQQLPVLIGCEVAGTAVFVAVELSGISRAHARKGFRRSKPRPQSIVADGFRMKDVTRHNVKRADYSWVHGRANDPDVETLRASKVGVIGCGAIGAYLAKSLAQAGVGMLVLVDDDDLLPNNVGRHALGMGWVGVAKAAALGAQIKKEIPHILDVLAFKSRFDRLDQVQLDGLASCDLVVLAGIDLLGERSVDSWRRALPERPALLWTWLEEFAVAGHAVAIVDEASIKRSLDADGAFQMRLTSKWPRGVAHATEAGCGVSYQPYSAIDMMGTINIANRLALDILLGKIERTVVRSWLGNKAFAEEKRCSISEDFDRSFSEISREWRW